MKPDARHEPIPGEPIPGHEEPLRAVASALASGVAGQLSQPLRELRENLAVMVETLDRYVADAPGPTPYPWKSLNALRQELAQAYLLSREVARLAGDLQEGVSGAGAAAHVTDVNRCVESALNLARHRVSSHTEVFVDLGSLPPVHAVTGELVLAIAKLVLCCAESAALREGSALSIKTSCSRAREIETVVISIADNGMGLPAGVRAAEQVVAPVARRARGTFEGISQPGRGSAFECRLPAIPAAVAAISAATPAVPPATPEDAADPVAASSPEE
jgi:C4-dicarboxylate-specific signal transduction histidine kinase